MEYGTLPYPHITVQWGERNVHYLSATLEQLVKAFGNEGLSNLFEHFWTLPTGQGVDVYDHAHQDTWCMEGRQEDVFALVQLIAAANGVRCSVY